MASLRKKSGSKFWFACFTDRNGRRRQVSTKEAVRKRAQKLADEYEEAARNKRTAAQSRRVISTLHKEITGESLVTATVRQVVADWIAEKEGSTAASTVVFYRNSTKQLLESLGAKADEDIALIERADIIRFRKELGARLAAKTANHHIKACRMVFRAAKRDGQLVDDPCEFVKTVSTKGKQGAQRKAFTIDQLKAVLKACDAEWRSMVMFGLYTGQRLGDIARLNWSAIDIERGEIRLVTGKTGREMKIFMPEPLLKHVAELDAPDDPDAPIHPKAAATADKNGTGHLSNQFARILTTAGLRKAAPHRKSTGEGRGGRHHNLQLSFHSLRATATTLLHEAGVPAAVAQELIGHDSEEIHRQYVKVGDAAMKEAAGKLPDISMG